MRLNLEPKTRLAAEGDRPQHLAVVSTPHHPQEIWNAVRPSRSYGAKVSQHALGTMNFGWHTDEPTIVPQADR